MFFISSYIEPNELEKQKWANGLTVSAKFTVSNNHSGGKANIFSDSLDGFGPNKSNVRGFACLIDPKSCRS